MKSLLITLYLVLLSANAAVASIQSVFEKNYFDSYRPGKCGLNVLSFFERLSSDGVDIRGLSLVYLENKGLTVFGMVNAEKARATLHGKLTTEEKNWYQHQFAIDKNGMVYDFDYSNSPKPTPLNKYAEDMYLIEDECLSPKTAEFCAGRKNKLVDYQLKLYEAKDVLEQIERPYWTGSRASAG